MIECGLSISKYASKKSIFPGHSVDFSIKWNNLVLDEKPVWNAQFSTFGDGKS